MAKESKMNRIIKFRAWDIKTKTMWHQHPTLSCFECLEHVDKDRVSFSDALNCTNFKIMQFTGFKDVNGKEIYDGDIFKDTFSGNGLFYKVFWDESAGGWRYKNGNVSGLFFTFEETTLEDCEVVGNIHQNPELMEANNG